ncbi:hypothetical protein [Rodentibacter caecimuris]|uniref:hypothetical protein n=1 Tax=Rodentibacter caecimuris TaxID=1796644 RepID=UPI0009C977BD|nr:hypothetical protein BKG97_10175 [Rodentibacter heylii]
MVAFYQKNMEGSIRGLGNSTIQAKNLMNQYGKDNLYIGAHSRGTLTVDNALNAFDTPNNVGLLSGTTIKMVGPAANVENADERLARLQGFTNGRTSAEGSIIMENNRYDGVGRIVGGNSYTNEDTKFNLLKMGWDILFGDTSPHNCSGIGNAQCIQDGYRKDQQMNLERRVYDLNKQNNKE